MPVSNSDRELLGSGPNAWGASLSAWEQLFFIKPLAAVYSRVRKGGASQILERLLSEMKIDVCVPGEDLARIPQNGAALVVANHPFGILDGAALVTLLQRIRHDVKIVTNYLVSAVEELAELCIHVDPFARETSHWANVIGLRQAVNHLKHGGMLAMFPAGEVSHWQFQRGEITDPEWNPTAARLGRMTGAPVIPALFEGRNSLRFQLMGLVHPRLRTLQLPRELLNKTGKQIELRIGTPVTQERLRRLGGDVQAIAYLRWRTYLLRRRFAHSLADDRREKPRFETEAPSVGPALIRAGLRKNETVADEIAQLAP
jgi:putative hemolysin